MSDFRFADPQWIHGLWAVLGFVALLVWMDGRAGRQLGELVSRVLQQRLARRASPGQRRLRVALLGGCGVFAVLALMRPQWGLEYVATPRSSAELMIALDVSRSMLAEDAAPNRLERAKAEIRDLLGYLDGDHVGLIAFAGRASVLSPLTPDHGFFRLVLDAVGPQSVGRGGTRLEEPVRRAIEGFRATGDVSRTLLLITDGEDHDSFPVEAAREAAARGVSIIAIGYGSEEGSEIPITDPRTGARTLLRDSEGRVVKTRLDGATLREMALVTGGVYIPAGTGALDLESIYDAHIASLVRGPVEGRGRAQRTEGFQWAVLLALLCLLASAIAGRVRPVSRVALLATALCVAGSAARAQAPQPEPNLDPVIAAETEVVPEDESPPEPPADPRLAYNAGLELIRAGSFATAIAPLETARAGAESDGEVRYRAIYALGFAEASRADELLESDAQAALDALRLAGDHFGEAVRLRPHAEDPRHNLEVVLQRAALLADSLRKSEERDVAAVLDALIERQRGQVAALRLALGRMGDDVSGEADRRELRGLGAAQRQILSDADALAASVAEERSALEAKPTEELSREEHVRIVQLGQLEYYLHRGRERMGHARRELRQARLAMAARRAAASLIQLGRARDQLRGPVELLESLVRDATEVAVYTQLLASSTVPGAPLNPAQSGIPAWLDVDYLEDSQNGVSGRTGELRGRLGAGLSQQEESGEPPHPEEARLFEAVRVAEPHVARAEDLFIRSGTALDAEMLADAALSQREGVAALAEAREAFLDLRGLVETTWADQVRVSGVVGPEEEDDLAASARAAPGEYLPTLRELQERNLARTSRIQDLIDQELGNLALAAEAAAEGEPAPDVEQEKKRLKLATGLVALASGAMEEVLGGLADAASGDPSPAPEWAALSESSERGVKALSNLRRLFFSLVEHLRDTAEQQQKLGDETEQAAASAAQASPELGPLIPRQEKLAQTALDIASALEEQSRESPASLVDPAAPAPDDQVAETERLRRAAESTLLAQEAMVQAASHLAAGAADVEAAREQQDTALANLLEALAQLSPPEQPPDEAGDEGQQEQNQQAQQGGGQQGEPEQQQAEAADPSQMLQSVRDREAKRRQDRAGRAQSGYETVERDW